LAGESIRDSPDPQAMPPWLFRPAIASQKASGRCAVGGLLTSGLQHLAAWICASSEF
jgi:hypothetical protein